MVLYNKTVSLDGSIAVKWVSWIRTYYIPKVIGSGMAYECRLCKIRSRDPQEISYSLQLIYENEAGMNDFEVELGKKLRMEMERLFSGKYVFFETILDIVYTKSLD